MKPQEIQKLVQLDPNGLSGTIMQTLLHPKVNEVPYADALYHLLSKTLEERQYLERISTRMTNALKSAGLLSNDLLEIEENLK